MKQRELIEVDSVKDANPLNNHILIKVDRKNDRINVNGEDIYIDTSFKVGHHSEVEGIVQAMPENNTMEVNVGDRIWFDYFTGYNGDKVKDKDGDIYYLIPYDYCYATIREWKREVLNDWILGTKVKKKLAIDLDKDYFHDDIYMLTHVPEGSKLNAGDKVRTKTSHYPVLEYKDHLRFDGKEHWVIQEKDIVFVY